jgi:4-hydroxythreonine-4-phosphate dehydrogenase
LAVTVGDPAGIGPELLARLLADPPEGATILPVAEAAAFVPLVGVVDLEGVEARQVVSSCGRNEASTCLIDPVGSRRPVQPGHSGAADAHAALAALDAGVALVQAGVADALVTLPVAKHTIATHCLANFRGHTEHLAKRVGLEQYGRDYLMAFLAPTLKVALLSTHLPLRSALDHVSPTAIDEALACLARNTRLGRVAVAAFNPHAGESGLLGYEDTELVAPGVELARRRGLDVAGPESADSLFARAAHGEFDWVLALYHDQGLIAVKTAAFGLATNWTVGLPYLRTSVDHGTAFGIAGLGRADDRALRSVVATTLELLATTDDGARI